MKLTPDALALIKSSEGFRAKPYRCPAGVWTIGYGHTRGVTSTMPPVTQKQAEMLLKEDLIAVEHALRAMLQRELSDSQYSSLVSFGFNAGTAALRKSRLLRLVNQGDMLAAAAEFERWVYAAGVKQPGLVKRRAAEKTLFLMPEVI